MYIKIYTLLGGCIFFIYTLHFSLVHSQTVVSVLHVIYMLSVFFDLRCKSVTYTYMHMLEHLQLILQARAYSVNINTTSFIRTFLHTHFGKVIHINQTLIGNKLTYYHLKTRRCVQVKPLLIYCYSMYYNSS